MGNRENIGNAGFFKIEKKDDKVIGVKKLEPGSPELKAMSSKEEEAKSDVVEPKPVENNKESEKPRDTSKDARFFDVSGIKAEKDRQTLETLRKEELKRQIIENVQKAQNE